MRYLLVITVLLSVVLLGTAPRAVAGDGDAPSGPEACLTDRLNDRRAGGDLSWSGAAQDSLRDHAQVMADTGVVSHDQMQERVADLPEGWSGYGETSSVASLASAAEVEDWCRRALDGLWASDPHRRTLTDSDYDFVSVGVHWDGEMAWIVIGVFAHPDYNPPPVDWPSSYADGLGWDGTFRDDDGNMFEEEIERLARAGVTSGCNPPANDLFCPDGAVTRGQMAAFLVRALEWEGRPAEGDFVDDEGSVFETDIELLAGAEVTRGCNPPDNSRFCPHRAVTRAEMATFLGRALGLEPSDHQAFADTAGSVHRRWINALFEAGITVGCAGDDKYCPDEPVTRSQMAAFLVRAGLAD